MGLKIKSSHICFGRVLRGENAENKEKLYLRIIDEIFPELEKKKQNKKIEPFCKSTLSRIKSIPSSETIKYERQRQNH